MTPEEIDREDREAHAAAMQHDWLRVVCIRRWRDPMTLRNRSVRARESLRAQTHISRETFARRHAVIHDALCAHALAAHGRAHWLSSSSPFRI